MIQSFTPLHYPLSTPFLKIHHPLSLPCRRSSHHLIQSPLYLLTDGTPSTIQLVRENGCLRGGLGWNGVDWPDARKFVRLVSWPARVAFCGFGGDGCRFYVQGFRWWILWSRSTGVSIRNVKGIAQAYSSRRSRLGTRSISSVSQSMQCLHGQNAHSSRHAEMIYIVRLVAGSPASGIPPSSPLLLALSSFSPLSRPSHQSLLTLIPTPSSQSFTSPTVYSPR
jgi:hypothetical protein